MSDWDGVPTAVPARSMNELTSEQKAEAYAWAQERAANSNRGVEYWMAQYFSDTIAQVQNQQFDEQRERLKGQVDEVVARAQHVGLTQEEIEALLVVGKKIADEFGTAMAGIADALIAAIRPIQELAERYGLLPEQPSMLSPMRPKDMRLTPLCPSHGHPLKGGRCTMCDRRR